LKYPAFRVPLVTNVQLYFNRSDYFDTPDSVELEQSTGEAVIQLTGRKPVSLVYLDIADCTTEDGSECQLDVTGLNFDFLLLNLIGFSAYAIYNLLMYYDPVVQNEYETKHPRSPIPVLLNDVVFAVHAFAACVVTAAQCFLLERANQRVSVTCMILSALLILFAIGSGVATVLKFLTILQFVMCFSYIKMAVTLSKYFPQMYFNFRRKSTVGWSIGNVLLDFTGGTLDILQMVLQCINAADWVAFYGNPVKFGLGLVSIVFDVIFIFQHYVLYRGVEVVHADYEGIENPEAPQSSPPTNHGAINPPNQPIFDEEMR
ncbi:Lysosomal Cystine Transporter, partial [Ancylostoma ceylanicum]